MTRSPARDRGFALIAVLLVVAALAGLAFDVLLQNRTAIVEAQAEVDRAHLENAASSATALALVGLSQPQAARWPIDGSPRTLAVDGADVTVAIEDERGKIPLNVLSEQEVRRMFEGAGARGRVLDTLTDSFLDWRDDDDQRRPFGAESADYAPLGYRSRDGDVTAMGELARVRGMTPALLARLAPATTLWFGESGGFAGATAGPLARMVMSPGPEEGGNPSADVAQPVFVRASAVRRDLDDNLRGRRLTIRVLAHDARGGVLHRATVIEFTANPRDPIWIRARD